MNVGEFNGKTVLVTGAAQGIGSVVAKMFLERGATVIAVDQNGEGLNVLLNQNETRMKIFHLDVSDSNAVEDTV
ncbi:SDR family NAD(P)-dependent oxidoreductase, partial [Vibrio parahaemolyticus]|nr:SDR family NAD(P)-dependent oxidoreductase [Vibrio parahaemolyticus]